MGSLAGSKFSISYNESTSKFDISVIDFFGAETDKIDGFIDEVFFTPPSDVILLASGELDFPTETSTETYKIKFVGNVSTSSLGISFVSSTMQPIQGYDLAVEYSAYQKMCSLLGYSQVNSTVDLTQLNTRLDSIQQQIGQHDGNILSRFGSISASIGSQTSTIMSHLSPIKNLVELNIDSKISEISVDLTPLQESINNLVGFDFSGSLNGASGSYPDDTKVTIDGYKGEYIVSSSNVMKYDENLHIIIYRCKKDDKYFNVPSNMVSLYVAPTP